MRFFSSWPRFGGGYVPGRFSPRSEQWTDLRTPEGVPRHHQTRRKCRSPVRGLRKLLAGQPVQRERKETPREAGLPSARARGYSDVTARNLCEGNEPKGLAGVELPAAIRM